MIFALSNKRNFAWHVETEIRFAVASGINYKIKSVHDARKTVATICSGNFCVSKQHARNQFRWIEVRRSAVSYTSSSDCGKMSGAVEKS